MRPPRRRRPSTRAAIAGVPSRLVQRTMGNSIPLHRQMGRGTRPVLSDAAGGVEGRSMVEGELPPPGSGDPEPVGIFDSLSRDDIIEDHVNAALVTGVSHRMKF